MITNNSTYDEVVQEFGKNLAKYISSPKATLGAAVSNDLAYIRDNIAKMATAFNKDIDIVDNDIARVFDKNVED